MANPIIKNEKDERSYDNDAVQWLLSSPFVYFFAAIAVSLILALVLSLFVGSEKSRCPYFANNFTDTISLDPIIQSLSSKDKGNIIVRSSVDIIGHKLQSDINIMANFPTSQKHTIEPISLTHSEEEFELAKSFNSLHQRLIMRRLGTTSAKFTCPLEFRDFQLTSKEKCTCSSVLSDKSFISMKVITFRHKMTVEDKIEYIRRNQSFDLSSLPAIPKTGIINATKSHTLSQKYASVEAELQLTEIVKLIPPMIPGSIADINTSNIDQLICYIRLFTDNSTETINCNPPSAYETPKPSPSSCRHITRSITDYGIRNIPETIISTFFCH